MTKLPGPESSKACVDHHCMQNAWDSWWKAGSHQEHLQRQRALDEHQWQGCSCCVLSNWRQAGLPSQPHAIWALADGLHRYLKLYCPDEGFVLGDGTIVPDLGSADDCVLLATSAAGLQRVLDAAGRFLASMGMVISIFKTFVLVLNLAFSGPYQCHHQWGSPTDCVSGEVPWLVVPQ